MFNGLFKLSEAATLIIGLTAIPACAQGTIRITIPRHSSLSVVQRLNREGVDAVNKHDYSKAAGLFYKAYLYDPADPFTLNNLAYIAEVQGRLDQAVSFYKLAAEQSCDADIDLSNEKRLEGQPMEAALTGNRETPMRVTEINVQAVHLLSDGHGAEAASLLEQALSLDPKNPFTLNNLGVANEAIGNDRDAFDDYVQAAGSGSQQAAAVTQDRSWQGRSVSEIARANASRLQKQLEDGSQQRYASELTLRGVMAENENDWPVARRDFMQAYSLDPSNAFTINNRGFVAEKDGDPESAQFFYHKAEEADGAHLRVGLATNQSQQGEQLSRVAIDSGQKVGNVLDVYSQQRHELRGTVGLTPRGPGSDAAPNSQTKQTSSPVATPVPPRNSKPKTR